MRIFGRDRHILKNQAREDGMSLRITTPTKFAAVVLVLGCAACGSGQEGWQGRIETQEGVTVVHNPREPLYGEPILTLEEDLTIRGDETREEQMFQDVRTLAVDETGNIYALDEQAGNIKIFDGQGQFLRTIGQKGQGPGEFGLPIAVLITPDREILVHDMGQRALKFLDQEGRFLHHISIADKFQFYGPRFLTGGRLVGSHLVPAEKPMAVLKLFDARLEPVETLISLPVTPPPALNFFAMNSMTGLRWNKLTEDTVVWGDFLKPEYALYIHNREGRHTRTIIRAYDPIRITETDKKALLDKMFDGKPPPPQWDIQMPDRFPPFSGISCDDKGRIYVRTHESYGQEGIESYDLFDARGRYAARLLLEVPVMVLKHGFLYTIVEDGEGFRHIKRFRLKWERDV
jgi:hypothetical protein